MIVFNVNKSPTCWECVEAEMVIFKQLK